MRTKALQIFAIHSKIRNYNGTKHGYIKNINVLRNFIRNSIEDEWMNVMPSCTGHDLKMLQDWGAHW